MSLKSNSSLSLDSSMFPPDDSFRSPWVMVNESFKVIFCLLLNNLREGFNISAIESICATGMSTISTKTFGICSCLLFKELPKKFCFFQEKIRNRGERSSRLKNWGTATLLMCSTDKLQIKFFRPANFFF